MQRRPYQPSYFPLLSPNSKLVIDSVHMIFDEEDADIAENDAIFKANEEYWKSVKEQKRRDQLPGFLT